MAAVAVVAVAAVAAVAAAALEVDLAAAVEDRQVESRRDTRIGPRGQGGGRRLILSPQPLRLSTKD